MKKIIFIFSIALSVLSAHAQDSTAIAPLPAKEVNEIQPPPAEILKTKKGLVILPEAKDWRISGGADALLNYAGNMFNKDYNYAFSPLYGQSISLSYFKSATKAYVATLSTSIQNETKTNYVSDDLNTSSTYKEVMDKRKFNKTYVALSFGIEKRKGQRRLQGIYGASAWASINKSSYNYSYGNAFSSSNTTPTSTSTYGNFDYPSISNIRTTKDNSGLTIGFGATLKVGVEYFFAPKISIGAAYYFGPSVSFTGKGSRQTESFTNNTNSINNYRTGNETTFSILTNSGGLTLNLYL